MSERSRPATSGSEPRGALVKGLVLLLGLSLLVAAGVWVLPSLLQRRCVVEGTLVATPEGPRPIDVLRPGDPVWSLAPSGEPTVGVVVSTFPARATEHLELVFEGRVRLGVTAEHPIATPGGWTAAGALHVGQRVITRRGQRTLSAIHRRGAARVFDISVSPHPNFFAADVLVHNKMSSEAQAIGTLKLVAAAQRVFRDGDKEGDEVFDYGSLEELVAVKGPVEPWAMLDLGPREGAGLGTRFGYIYEVSYSRLTSEFLWYATARPQYPVVKGMRYFATNQQGVTFYTTERPFRLNTVDCTIPAGVLPVGK